MPAKTVLQSKAGLRFDEFDDRSQLFVACPSSAAQSIPLNIAEGRGKQSLKAKNRFIEIARGSELQCAAIHDVLLLEGRYADCDKVIVVCDNLNTHSIDAF